MHVQCAADAHARLSLQTHSALPGSVAGLPFHAASTNSKFLILGCGDALLASSLKALLSQPPQGQAQLIHVSTPEAMDAAIETSTVVRASVL